MAAGDAVKAAIDTLCVDRKGLAEKPGFGEASKAWDLIRDRPEDTVPIWTIAVFAECAGRIAWGAFRALADGRVVETTNALFAFPKV